MDKKGAKEKLAFSKKRTIGAKMAFKKDVYGRGVHRFKVVNYSIIHN